MARKYIYGNNGGMSNELSSFELASNEPIYRQVSPAPTAADVADAGYGDVTPDLIRIVAECLDLNAALVNPVIALTNFGVDALSALRLTLAVQRELGTFIDPVCFLDGSCIRQLAQRARSPQ